MIKKHILLLGTFFIYFYCFSQEKQINIKLENSNHRFLKIENDLDNGNLFLFSGRDFGNHLVKKFHAISNELDRKIEFEIDKTIIFDEYLSSGFGDYLIEDKIINNVKNIKTFPYKSVRKFSRKSKVNPIFDFFNHYATSFIGPKIGRKNARNKYSNNDLFIKNLRHEDLKEEIFPLDIVEIETNQKNPSWYLSRHKFKNSFFLISKDLTIFKDRSKRLYHFVEYNFKGKVESYSKLPINLEDNKYHLPTLSFYGVSSGVEYTGRSYQYASSYIDKQNNTIMLYGYYSNKKGKQIRVGKVDGIYAYKFEIGSSKLIWKTYYPFKKRISNYLYKRKIEHFSNGQNDVIHCFLDSKNAFLLIDKKTGEILKRSNELVDLFEKESILKNNDFLNLDIFSGNFKDTFKNKRTNKNKISTNVLAAALLKPEIKQFLLNKTSGVKNRLYKARIVENGEIFLFELIKKGNEINIFKF